MTKAKIVEAALQKHLKDTDMTEDTPPGTAVFQFVFDLLEYCDANGVDFDAIVSEARDCDYI